MPKMRTTDSVDLPTVGGRYIREPHETEWRLNTQAEPAPEPEPTDGIQQQAERPPVRE